jgi:hypothetical protein
MSTLEFSKEEKRASTYNNLKYKYKNMKKQIRAAAMERSKRRIPADATALMPFPIYCHQDKGLKRQNFSVFGKKKFDAAHGAGKGQARGHPRPLQRLRVGKGQARGPAPTGSSQPKENIHIDPCATEAPPSGSVRSGPGSATV